MNRNAPVLWPALGCAALLLSAGCHPAAPGGEEKEGKAATQEKKGEVQEGVTLKPEEVAKAGIKTTPAAASQHAPETTGYAVVITREAFAQAIADLNTAAAVDRQSRAALARSKSLAGTPGAMPVEAQEAAERQATVDHAALTLAERRLSAAYGQSPPWKTNYSSPELAALASGEKKLARVTFPLGSLGPGVPATLRLAHIGAAPDARSIEAHEIWSAPADASLPGRSFFAILKGHDVSEGERLLVRAPVGDAEPGVVVPIAAVVMNGGKYWVYVEDQPNHFLRTEIDPSVPVEGGYFVRQGVAAGSSIVTSSAALLLARELGTEAAD
jgi:hypothetical protein